MQTSCEYFSETKILLSTDFYPREDKNRMKEQPEGGGFGKVGECLYRYSSTGGYYARVKMGGKEIRRSLVTMDRDPAKCRLAKLKDDLLKIDPAKGRITLAERRSASGSAALTFRAPSGLLSKLFSFGKPFVAHVEIIPALRR